MQVGPFDEGILEQMEVNVSKCIGRVIPVFQLLRSVYDMCSLINSGIDLIMNQNKLDAITAPSGGVAWTTDLVRAMAVGWVTVAVVVLVQPPAEVTVTV